MSEYIKWLLSEKRFWIELIGVFFLAFPEIAFTKCQRLIVQALQSPFSLRAVGFFSGYDYGYPFIDKDVVDVQENVLDFYLYEFLPDLEKQTMAFIGCVQPIGAIMPIAELQCRYAMQVFKVNEHSPFDRYSTCIWWLSIKMYNCKSMVRRQRVS